jgi:hypothetical protein
MTSWGFETVAYSKIPQSTTRNGRAIAQAVSRRLQLYEPRQKGGEKGSKKEEEHQEKANDARK